MKITKKQFKKIIIESIEDNLSEEDYQKLDILFNRAMNGSELDMNQLRMFL